MQKLTHPVRVRLTEEDGQRLRDAARKLGKKPAVLARLIILDKLYFTSFLVGDGDIPVPEVTKQASYVKED